MKRIIFLTVVFLYICSCQFSKVTDPVQVEEDEEFIMIRDTLYFNSSVFDIDTIIYFDKVVEVEEGYESKLHCGLVTFTANQENNLTDQKAIDLIQFYTVYSRLLCAKDTCLRKGSCVNHDYLAVVNEVFEMSPTYNGKWQGVNGVSYEVSVESVDEDEYKRLRKMVNRKNCYRTNLGNTFMKICFKNQAEYEIFIESHDTYFM